MPQDTITKGNWNFNLGMRGDLYNGLTTHAKPSRAWALPTTSSRATRCFVFLTRAPWKRPFNENLVLVQHWVCQSRVLTRLLGCSHARRLHSAAELRAGAMNSTPASAGVRPILGVLRRVHLEVHAQRL